MVSFREASLPLRPIYVSISNEKYLSTIGDAFRNYEDKRYSRARRIFDELAISFGNDKSRCGRINCLILQSDSLKMKALQAYRKQGLAGDLENILREALDLVEQALKLEPYWAEYLIYRDKLKKYLHDTFGCMLPKEGDVWEVHCYKIARQSGLPGLSVGGLVDLECSICGKDPIDCEHIVGRVYDGRMALHVVKNLKANHVALVDTPRQRETYVMPRPLTEYDIRRLFSQKEANLIISGEKQLRCKDLLKVLIEKNVRLSPILDENKGTIKIKGTVLTADD
mgnify:CR=1 FL=1